MDTKRALIFKIVFGSLVLCVLVPSLVAETLYVDSRNGNDTNPGALEKPLFTINKAVAMVNDSNDPGPTTIKINPGAYCLTEVAIIENNRKYTRENRFIIEAAVLPDDPNWRPALMPVVLSTSKGVMFNGEEHTASLKIEINHATVRGIKFLGNPKPRTWHYAVYRQGKELKDLLVTQCLFVGDEHAIPYNCCICANGHKLVLDHNIFYHCEIPVVFWNARNGVSKGNAMRYCIVDGAAISAVWTCQTGEDFEFHHNVVARSGYFWMRAPRNRKKYQIRDCIVTDSKYYSGYGTSAAISGQSGSEINFVEKNVVKTGKVVLEKNELGPRGLSREMPRNYLHVMPGTLGSNLGAGLFKKKLQKN